MQSEKWDRRFLDLAEHISSWSRDPSTRVGAVIVDDKRRVVSHGFNGFPQGIEDKPERYENRETKYQYIVHGEINALLFASRSVEGMTLYTFPFMPCARCTVQLIQSGIKRVVSLENDNPRWQASFALALDMFEEAGVEVKLYHQ